MEMSAPVQNNRARLRGRLGVMGADDKRDDYLALAKEAENKAAHTRERYEQESLLRIADSYRELARRQGARQN